MTASLVVAGFETYDPTVQRPYQLSGLGWIAGDPLPDQAEIEKIVLDGEAVTGDRTRNRNVQIPLWVRGNDALDLAANLSALWQAVDKSSFTVEWTPNGGLPVIYDCARATVTRPLNIYLTEQFVAAVMITCSAQPFGRSPDAESVEVSTTLQIDSFATAPTGATLNTTTKYEGTGSAQLAFTYSGVGINPGSTSAPVSRTFAAKDLSSYANVSMRLYLPGTGTAAASITLTLSSAGGSTTYPIAATTLKGTKWGVLYIPLTGGTVTSGTGVDLSAVTGYSLRMFVSRTDLHSSYALVDDMRAAGTASALFGPTSHAVALSVPVTVGAARAPANLELTNESDFTSFLLHSPPADQDPSAQILTALASGSTDQTVTIPALNGNLRGTFAVYLGVDAVGSGAQVAHVTIQQQQGGVNVGAPADLTYSYTAGTRILPLGEVTLPLYDVPDDNTGVGYTIRVRQDGGGTSDGWSEVMLCDTRGQTIYTDTELTTAVAAAFVDEPAPLQSGPSVYGAATDRTDARNVLANCWLSGGPIVVEPGDNKFLAWVSTATPVLTAAYYPRWPFDRAA